MRKAGVLLVTDPDRVAGSNAPVMRTPAPSKTCSAGLDVTKSAKPYLLGSRQSSVRRCANPRCGISRSQLAVVIDIGAA
jgi:hypothetical protein